jgi:hypothetical protein
MAMKHESVKTVVHLSEAIDKLKAFTSNHEDRSVSPLSRTVGLMNDLFKASSGENPGKPMREELIHAIEVIHHNMGLLERLNEGSGSQKKLAAAAIAVIDRYNELQESKQKKRSFFREALKGFLSDKENHSAEAHLPKIQLPNRVRTGFSTPYQSAASVKVSQVAAGKRQMKMHPIAGLTRQAADLFYMKAISLLENELAFSNKAAREVVSNAIVDVMLVPDNALCRVSCYVHLPDEPALIISGDFSKFANGMEYDFPIRDSFAMGRQKK